MRTPSLIEMMNEIVQERGDKFYMMYRVAYGLYDYIKISFLPVGYTKFSPDWCFGLFKRHFQRSKVGCLDDIVWVVNESAAPNVAECS